MINLLPPRVQRKKDRLSLLMLLATVQVAIFFILGLLSVAVMGWEQQAWEHSNEMNMLLAAFDSHPAEVAARLHNARTGAAYLDAFIDGASPVTFDREWLPEILSTIPYGAQLARLDYHEGELILTGVVTDFTLVEIHRTKMSEIFHDVRLGRITHLSDTLYSYELLAQVGARP